MDTIQDEAFETQASIDGVSVCGEVFDDPVAFIHAVREGISGEVLKEAIDALGGNRELFVRLLETSPGNLHRFYKRENLGRGASEEVLDTLRVFRYAVKVFGDQPTALDWLQTPIPALASESAVDLFDTFKGRQMVMQVLRKIEFGEFS